MADLGRAVAFYRDIVGLPPALEIPERGATFFWVVEPGQAMLGLCSLGSMPMSLSLHVAFDVALDEVLAAPERLRAQGVEPLSFVGQTTDEPSVLARMPAAAVYLRHLDGHQARVSGHARRRAAARTRHRVLERVGRELAPPAHRSSRPIRRSKPAGAWMLSIRTGAAPSLRKPCSTPGGTRTNVPGEAVASSPPKMKVISPWRM